MKKKIVALTIALIMLVGIQTFATTGLSLTPTGSTTGVGTSTTATPAPTGTITPTTGSASTTTPTPTPVSSTGTTSSTSSEAPVVSSTTKPETSLPKAGTSNVVLYGVSVLAVVAIALYRKITK
jgi:mucin-2 precursor (intestinal mucin-2).